MRHVERRNVSSGSPYEQVIGFSRAVRAGHHVTVGATAPIMPDGGEPPDDAYRQAKRCIEIVVTALEEAGATVQDIVRTRCFLTDLAEWEDVARAHGEVFGDVRPASSFIGIEAFIEPRWKVEIEADAIVDG
jgi:enamine deaminase RidA (YjgF/YER057c/UK114 family)